MSFRASCRRQSHNGIRPCAPSLSAAPFRSAKTTFRPVVPIHTGLDSLPRTASSRMPSAAPVQNVRCRSACRPSRSVSFRSDGIRSTSAERPRFDKTAYRGKCILTARHLPDPAARSCRFYADYAVLRCSARPSLVISPAPQQRLGSYRPCGEALRTASRDRLRSTTCCS